VPDAPSLAPPSALDWVRLAVPGLIWGASFYFIAEGLEAFPPALIAPMRVAFGCLALTPLRNARTRMPIEAWKGIFFVALLWMAVPLSMFPFAEERVSSSVTGMLNGATPLFIAAVGALVFGMRPSRAQGVGLLVGFAGVVLIAVPTATEGSASVEGVALIFVALVCYGFSLNIALPLQQKYGSLPVVWRAQLLAVVMTAPFAVPSIDGIEFAWGPFLMIVVLGVFGTGIAFALTVANTGRLGANRASVTVYLTPVVALALGAFLRDESVRVLSVAGCGVALLGAYLAGRAP
jgi:drug/metabolite transporter (DMT)-like permease